MQKPGKIVVASQHYPPDQSTTAAIMSAISGHLAQGAPVLVLSGMAGSAQRSGFGFKSWVGSKRRNGRSPATFAGPNLTLGAIWNLARHSAFDL